MRIKILSALLLLSVSISSYARPTVEEVKRDIKKACRDANFNHKIMLGIISRESDFGATLDKNWKGDNSHGHGVAQIDDRYHKEFIRSGDWRSTYLSCLYAIRLIRSNLKYYGGRIQPAIAAYNAGRGNVRPADFDKKTTGGNYASDVLARAQKL
jgi:hypothetical protein